MALLAHFLRPFERDVLMGWANVTDNFFAVGFFAVHFVDEKNGHYPPFLTANVGRPVKRDALLDSHIAIIVTLSRGEIASYSIRSNA